MKMEFLSGLDIEADTDRSLVAVVTVAKMVRAMADAAICTAGPGMEPAKHAVGADMDVAVAGKFSHPNKVIEGLRPL